MIQGEYDLRDEHDSVTGKVAVKISLHNQNSIAVGGGMDSHSLLQHRRIHHDVIAKIVESLAQGEFEELDMYLDMLFMKDDSDMMRVTNEMFQEFIIVDMDVISLSKKDLQIFLSTHEQLKGKSFYTREELKIVFEGHFNQAKQ